MRRAIAAAALLLAGTLIWGFRLALGMSPWAPSSGTLVGAGLVAMAAISVVGMLVAAGRWARRLGMAVAGAGLGLAVVMPVDGWWWAGLLSSGVALAALVGTVFKGIVRERPSAEGPPDQAVLLILMLLAAPVVIGGGAPGGVGPLEIGVAVGTVVGAGWYAKAFPAALAIVRFLIPLMLLAGAVAGGLPSGLAPGALAVLVGWLAWTKGARIAVRPVVERGSIVKMPPELVPRDILDAAGLDERGKRKP